MAALKSLSDTSVICHLSVGDLWGFSREIKQTRRVCVCVCVRQRERRIAIVRDWPCDYGGSQVPMSSECSLAGSRPRGARRKCSLTAVEASSADGADGACALFRGVFSYFKEGPFFVLLRP